MLTLEGGVGATLHLAAQALTGVSRLAAAEGDERDCKAPAFQQLGVDHSSLRLKLALLHGVHSSFETASAKGLGQRQGSSGTTHVAHFLRCDGFSQPSSQQQYANGKASSCTRRSVSAGPSPSFLVCATSACTRLKARFGNGERLQPNKTHADLNSLRHALGNRRACLLGVAVLGIRERRSAAAGSAGLASGSRYRELPERVASAEAVNPGTWET